MHFYPKGFEPLALVAFRTPWDRFRVGFDLSPARTFFGWHGEDERRCHPRVPVGLVAQSVRQDARLNPTAHRYNRSLHAYVTRGTRS